MQSALKHNHQQKLHLLNMQDLSQTFEEGLHFVLSILLRVGCRSFTWEWDAALAEGLNWPLRAGSIVSV